MSQKAAILAYLQKGNHLTPLGALNKFGCFRLAARVYELKCDGHKIKRHMLVRVSRTKIAGYYLG